MKNSVALVGSRGYVGKELVALVEGHTGLELRVAVSARSPVLGARPDEPSLDGMEAIASALSSLGHRVARRDPDYGHPLAFGRGHGDLLVTVRVNTPKKLTKEQKKLLEQLAATLPNEAFEPTPTSEHADKGLLDRVKDIFG